MIITLLLRSLLLFTLFLLPFVLFSQQPPMLDMRALAPQQATMPQQLHTGISTVDNVLRNVFNVKKIFDRKRLRDYRFQTTTLNVMLPVKLFGNKQYSYGLVFFYAKPRLSFDELSPCRQPLAAIAVKFRWKFLQN
jgi:hypothetical protein